MKTIVRSRLFWLLPAAAIPLILYLLTLCPTVYCGDGGELGLAATNLEIAHPPGYPLLTIFGHVWTLLFSFLRPIVALNLLSAVFAAAAAALLYLVLTMMSDTNSTLNRIACLALSTTFAFGQTLWSVATNYEVYSLGALLEVMIIAAAIKFYRTGRRSYFLIGCYLLGLSLCNHLSTVAFVPILLLAMWFRRAGLSRRDYWIGGALALLPLTFYGYLYLRSSFNLVLDWYDPQTFWGLKQHLFAATYQRYIATPQLADLIPYLTGVSRLLSHEFVLPFVVLALPGAARQFRRDFRLGLMMLTVVAVNCGLNFNYLIPDIMPYFLPTILACTVWLSESVCWLARRSPRWSIIAAGIAIMIAAVTAVGNFARSDISDRRAAEQYAQDLFERVPANGVLFCGSDNSMFPALYLHYVERYRPDCRVYGHLPTLVRLRSDLGLTTTPGYNKFPDLFRYAVAKSPEQIVCAREPMQMVNDFGALIPGLYADGLVYYPDSNAQIAPRTVHLNWRSPPKLYDQKESVLYVVYYLLNGESQNRAGDPEGERLWAKAVEIVRAQENFALSNELAAYFIRMGNLRLARMTLEQGLAIAGLRFGQRLRLLSSLGGVAFECGDEKKASEIFTQILEMEPNNAVAKYSLLALHAQTAVRSGRPQEAIDTYHEMLRLFPDQHEVNLRLGELLLKTGDTTAARTMLETCLRDNYMIEYVRQLLGSE